MGMGGGYGGGGSSYTSDAPPVQGSRIVDRYQAPRWLQQGRLELVAALRLLEPIEGVRTLPAAAVFHCQQACEMAIKAAMFRTCGISEDEESGFSAHNITDFVSRLRGAVAHTQEQRHAQNVPVDDAQLEWLRQAYLGARYPKQWDERIPAELYSHEQAEMAVGVAEKLLRWANVVEDLPDPGVADMARPPQPRADITVASDPSYQAPAEFAKGGPTIKAPGTLMMSGPPTTPPPVPKTISVPGIDQPITVPAGGIISTGETALPTPMEEQSSPWMESQPEISAAAAEDGNQANLAKAPDGATAQKSTTGEKRDFSHVVLEDMPWRPTANLPRGPAVGKSKAKALAVAKADSSAAKASAPMQEPPAAAAAQKEESSAKATSSSPPPDVAILETRATGGNEAPDAPIFKKAGSVKPQTEPVPSQPVGAPAAAAPPPLAPPPHGPAPLQAPPPSVPAPRPRPPAPRQMYSAPSHPPGFDHPPVRPPGYDPYSLPPARPAGPPPGAPPPHGYAWTAPPPGQPAAFSTPPAPVASPPPASPPADEYERESRRKSHRGEKTKRRDDDRQGDDKRRRKDDERTTHTSSSVVAKDSFDDMVQKAAQRRQSQPAKPTGADSDFLEKRLAELRSRLANSQLKQKSSPVELVSRVDLTKSDKDRKAAKDKK